jgi:hypothetical protein
LRQILGDEGWKVLVDRAEEQYAYPEPRGLRTRIRSLARQVIDASDFLSAMEGRLRPDVFGRRTVYAGGIRIHGPLAGFSNIAECARFAGTSFLYGFGSLEQAWAGGTR